MKRWKVSGANRQTGEAVEIIVDAATQADAVKKAGATGMLISAVVQEGPPVLPPQSPPAITPPLAYAMPTTPAPKKRTYGLGTLLLVCLGGCCILGVLVPKKGSSSSSGSASSSPRETRREPSPSSRQDASTGERQMAHESRTFKGLLPADVYLNFPETSNFKLEKRLGVILNEWSCVNENADRSWHVTIIGPPNVVTSVSSVNATSLNYSGSMSTAETADWLIARVATLPFEGAKPEQAAAWARSKLSVPGEHSASFGGATFRLYVRERAIILDIKP